MKQRPASSLRTASKSIRRRGLIGPAGNWGTSRRCGCRRPGRASGSACRSAGTADRPAGRRARSLRPRSSEARISRAASPSTRPSSSSLASPSARHGDSCACQSASAFHTFPIPATSRWSSRASPSSRLGCGAAQVRDHRGQVGRLARGCPARAAGSRGASARAPARSRAGPRARSPRRTSHGLPCLDAPALDHLPAAAHAQVAAQDDAALEAQEQVLADRLDTQQAPPVEALGNALRGRARVRRLDLRPARRRAPAASAPRGGASLPRACRASVAPGMRRAPLAGRSSVERSPIRSGRAGVRAQDVAEVVRPQSGRWIRGRVEAEQQRPELRRRVPAERVRRALQVRRRRTATRSGRSRSGSSVEDPVV